VETKFLIIKWSIKVFYSIYQMSS